jgi:amino acid adenylation domain-containing protein
VRSGPPPTLAAALRERAREHPERTAAIFLQDGETEADRRTYAALDLRARAIAARLQERGAQPGDRALLLDPPGLDFIDAFFGCLYAGVVAVPCHPPRPGREQPRLKAILADAGARFALTTAAIAGKLATLAADDPEIAELTRLASEDLPDGLAGAWQPPAVDSEALAFLQYTSGSTSTPKGVMVTHANLVFMERLIADVFRQDESSVVVGWLPVYHDMGLIGNVLQPLWLGATCVLMAPVAFLRRPRRWLEAISRYRATTSGGPSFAYELCADKIAEEDRRGLDLSSWRVAFNGAEPVRAAALERFAAAFAPAGFRREAFQPCYGLAEATLLVSGLRSVRSVGGPVLLEADATALEEGKVEEGGGRLRTLVGCGGVPAEQPVAVVDPATLRPCPPGRVGELWVRGPGVAAGYWRRPAETREVFGAVMEKHTDEKEGDTDGDTDGHGWLRTGDLGFLREGELFVTGRLKDLIILRGRNHYPQDLELTAERSAPGLAVGSSAAFSVDFDGEERLVVAQEVAPRARLDAAGLAAVAAAIRRAVAEEHEVQVWEVLLLKAGTIPKTSSGKIQRRATRVLYLDGALEPLGSSRLAPEPAASAAAVLDRNALLDLPAAGRAPALEAWLRVRAAEALRAPAGELDAERPLIDFGLDSLAAIELGQTVETALGVPLSPGDLLAGAGTGELARVILARLAEPPSEPRALPWAGSQGPLSHGQRGLWLLHRLNPASTAYHLAGAARLHLHGDVSAQALRAAFQALVDRHPVLRTTFHEEGGEPFQRVQDGAEVFFEEIAGGSLEEAAWRPFDLATGPLLRVTLFDRGVAGKVLLVVVHHIVADFWSFGVMAREMGEALARPGADGPGSVPLPLRGMEFARWQAERLAGPEGERLWAAWRSRLAGVQPLDLPTDRLRTAETSERGGWRGREIGGLEDLKALARSRGATLYAVLLAGFAALLSRFSGQSDFAVGSPVAGRPAGLPGAAEAVGYFVSPVALRADVSGEPSGEPSFADLVDRTRRRVLEALDLQEMPLPLLVEKLRAEGLETDLFRVLFVLHRAPAGLEGLVSLALGEAGGRMRLGGLEMEPLALPPRAAAFDLTLAVGERRGALGAALVFRADLFDATTAARWLEHYATLLAAAVAHPELPVGDLPLLPIWERQQVLLEANDPGWDGDRQPPWTFLHEGFEQQAARTPDAVALIDGTRRITYRDLNAAADRLAERLRSLGAGPERVVGVHLPRTAEMVTALLAVLKTGAAYLPLDPSYPEERIALLVKDAGAVVVIGPEGVFLPSPGDRAGGAGRGAGGEGLAYLIYTSGSTGRPKGVAITHASAVRLVAWAGEAYSRGELAAVLAATSMSFDLSVFEIFVPLSFGGAVVLAENALALPGLPAAGEVTLVNTVPSALAALLDRGPLPPAVRTVNLAGEPLRRPLAERVLATGAKLWDLYGPSEDTTYSTGAVVQTGDLGDPLIGRPVAGARAYVLDRSLHPAPLGIPGELCLGGGGVARGYLGRPDLTAERFVPDPFSRHPGARLYRTGDRARRTADGALDYLGRLDHQVKIRGFRIEPGEVEAALLEIPDIREAVVVPRDGVLVAYVVGEASSLRDRLRAKLPAPFIPSFFVVLGALPLTPNGKVDRNALPAPSSVMEDGAAAPAGPVEEALASLFAEALGVPRVGAGDDFFSLGGHSLLAARVLSRASRLFGVDLPLGTLFRSPTVAGLAAAVLAEYGGAAAAPPVRPVLRPHEGRGDLPPTFGQQRLWLLDRLRPGEATYNMPGALLLSGPLDVPALAAAFSAVVRRHESLRTRFTSRGGEPVQLVDPPRDMPFPLPVVDLSALPEPAREEAAGALAAAEAAQPFDLNQGSLLRVTLLRLAPERHLELLTVHHIVADGWSLGVLAGEIAAFYAGLGPFPDLPLQYADFAVWQREQAAAGALERQLAWWTERLAGAPAVLELPADRPRPAVRTARGARVGSLLPAPLAAGLRELARQRGATLFLTLLAGFQALLLRHTGQEDLLVGTATANRTRPETEGLIGLFADTLVLRAELAGDPDFGAALARARETALGAFAHQDLPFERLVAALQPERKAGEMPLLQAVLVLQGEPPDCALPGLAVRRVPVASGTAKFDLSLELEERETGISAFWELSRDLFDAATIERLAGHFTNLLAGAVAAPGSRLSELPLLGEAERRQLSAAGNPEPDRAPLAVPVHRLVEEQARNAPERTALVVAQGEVSYGELDARANRLARHLIALGVGPETPVGVALERSPEMIEAFLAILKAGGAYMPLDPTAPRQRLAEMMEEAGAGLVLTAERLEADRDAIAARSAAPMLPGACGEDSRGLACVLFTSGSTGRPKAVMVEHRSIVRLVRDGGFADLGPEQVFLQLAPPAFDASTLEIWGALANGGRLVVPPAGPLSLDELGDLLARHAVTTLWLTAGLFHEVAESRIGILRGVRQLLAGGDVLSPAAVNRVLAELPGCRMINGYGPTENTTFTCCHTVREPVPEGSSVPLGRPIGGTRVVVLDRRLQPVPLGVPGELWAGGAGLARGYLGRPGLTAERFAPDPDQPGERLYRTGDLVRWRGNPQGDLALEFLGRIDRQVKIRGFRVEPGEIEAVLARHPAVTRAAVLVHGEGAGGRRLVAFVVATEPAAELRSWLAERLPAYLVPEIAVVSELPLNASGKVDRAALLREWEVQKDIKDIKDSKDDKDTPRTPVEEVLAAIWADVLGVERVGLHDDFFTLGGHSLLATRALSRIVDALGTEIPLAALFETPTVAGLAASAAGVPPLPFGAGVWGPHGRGGQGERAPLSFAQQRLWFLDRLEPGSAAYNLPVALRLRGSLEVPALSAALAGIVRRHEALRTSFPETPDGPVQEIAPAPESYAVPVEDLSALGETAALRRMEEEGRRPFDLQSGPVFRPLLLRIAPEDHLLVVSLHHIAGDGWSMGLLVRELAILYSFPPLPEAGRGMGEGGQGGEGPLPALPIQYADFAVWQRSWLTGAFLGAELAWWRAALRGLPERLDLPTDHPRRGSEKRRGAQRPVHLDRALTRDLGALARRAGATPFMVLLAVFQALLGRYAGQEDLAVGSPVAGRTRTELEGLIGFFVNTLVLRADLSGNPDVHGLLRRTRSAVLAAHAHQHLPFERLVEELAPARELGSTPLFAAMLAFQGPVTQPPALPGLTAEVVPVATGTAKLDLLLDLGERGGALTGSLEYDADLFEPATLDRFLGHLRNLLAAAVDAPEQRVADLPLLSALETRQILEDWNSGSPSALPWTRLHEGFERQAARIPEATALIWNRERVTYADLNARADRLAGRLRELGAGPEEIVGICLPRTPEMVVALLAVLKAGAAYVPLDPAYPEERIAFMIEDAGVGLVIEEQGVFLPSPGDREGGAGRGAGGEGLAYLIYTSGSTGRPKGVAIEHASAVRLAAWAREVYNDAELAGVLAATSINFDLSIFEIFVPLSWGGAVILADDALALPSLPAAGEVTLVNTVPSAMAALLELGPLPPGVRTVNLAGEPLRRALADSVHAAGVGRLWNLYGPSEDTTYSTGALVEPGALAEPSIGRPVAGSRSAVVDRGLRLQPPGVPGELVLGGGGLARGYLRRPDLTAERFVPDPFSGAPGARLYRTGDLARRRPDGALDYLGRIDRQVKIRGFRIEPGEIEAVLLAHPEVREAAVVAYGGILVAFLTRQSFPPSAPSPVPSPARAPAPHPERERGATAQDKGQAPDQSPAGVPPLPFGAGGWGHARERGPGGEGGPVASNAVFDWVFLSSWLRTRLPIHMIPGLFVTLDALPLTPNGKVDRAALARLGPSGPVIGSTGEPPQGPAEETLAALWSDILGRPVSDRHASFFDLGGHSLLATRVVSRLRTTHGLEIPVRTLFEAPTVAKLAGHALLSPLSREGGARAGEGPGVRALFPTAERPAPLSFAQQRLWFLAQLDPASAVYNLPAAVDLSGTLDAGALAVALREIVRRHETLRTAFPVAGAEPVQSVGSAEDFHLPVVDLTALGVDGEAWRLTSEEAIRPFDLQRGPVFRALLLRLAADRHRLLVTMHHIVSDGWSLGVFVRELAVLYPSRVSCLSPLSRGREGGAGRGAGGEGPLLPALPVQYSDFAVWQRQWLTGDALERELAYWRGALHGLPPGLDLPTDRPRPPVQTFRGGSRPFVLGAGTAAGLRRLARGAGATLFMVLLAGFQMLLARLSGQDDLAVGTPVAGRTRTELEGLIGFFVNTLVLRAELADDPSFRLLLGRARERSLAGQAHQDVPFERLVEELKPERNLARPPLFQVLFVFQNTPRVPLDLPGLAVRSLPVDTGTAKFELHLSLEETEDREAGIAGAMDYNRDLFDASSIDRLLGQLATLLAAAAADPGRRLSDLPLLTAPERQQIVIEWNDGEDVPRDRTLPELFADQVQRRPDAIAVSCGADRLTYGELDRRSTLLARHLRAFGAAPEERVAICLERSTAMLVALLAVLRTGAAYVPLDSEHPAERQALVLGDAHARALITTPEIAARLDIPDGLPIVLPEDEGGGLDGPDPVSANAAYIIYTSGSSGRPKGVAVTHAEVVRLLSATDRWYRFGPDDAWALFFSFAFDFSVWEIWGALAYGGRLVIAPYWVTRAPDALYDLIADEGITVLNQTPSAFRQIIQAEADRPAPRDLALRIVIFGGEALDVASLAPWFARHGDQRPRLINMYGITETTVHSTYRPVTAPDVALAPLSPLGVPIPDLQIHILDRWLQPAPIGVPGEICVGGHGLARGYFHRPDLTAARFIPDPFAARPGARLYRSGDLARRLRDGDMDYLGRIDFQVKIRGFRIELGEIEFVIEKHPAVLHAAVLAREDRPDRPGDRRLVAYVVPRDGSLTLEDLRGALRQRLPEYMVPSAFVLLDALPLTANGKLDRRALPAPDAAARAPVVAPRTATEEAIAAVWRDVLGLPAVGVEDSFFDLGGHSLLIVQVHRQLAGQFPELAVVDLFRYPTIAALAGFLTKERVDQVSLEESRERAGTRTDRARQQRELRRQVRKR